MRIVVVTSCTGEKLVDHQLKLTLKDFQQGTDHVTQRELQLSHLLTPAEDLYSGLQHTRLMRGIKRLRDPMLESSTHVTVDLWILSAGYGLVPATHRLAPYEATFHGMKKAELRRWADQLKVPREMRRVLAEEYTLGLVLLGDEYLEACALDETVTLGGPTLLFCGAGAAKRLPKLEKLRVLTLGNADARRFSCGLVGLKGEIAARLLDRMVEPGFVETVAEPGADVRALLDGETGERGGGENHGLAQISVDGHRASEATSSADWVIRIPKEWWEKPHREKLRYFIPEWDDLVDPNYDFETDTHSSGTGDWSNEVYAHQLYPEPNYDGILVSKVVAEKSKKKKERINRLGVHRYLRVPPEFPVMGDCGAFGYIHEDVPPYTTEETLDYYTRLGFNYGVSVDHLIVAATEAQKRERYELTIHNAEEFLGEHKSRGLPWTPIGAVQGWSPESYADAARKYVAMGYRYIALGGLARSSTVDILRILREVRVVVPETVSVHLFGVARLKATSQFEQVGVSSFDSASYLRQAWMRDSQGYLLDGGSYAALRIPEMGRSFRAKQMIEEAGLDAKRALELERNALRAVRALAANSCSVDECLNALLEYDRYITRQRADMSRLYERTLVERPWELCDCALCKESGIEIVVFRGNNRNRRRGFHNTYVFYRLLQQALAGEIVSVGAPRATWGSFQLPLFADGEVED